MLSAFRARSFHAALLISLLSSLVSTSCRESRLHDKPEWSKIYDSRGVKDACFIVRDHNHEAVYFYNKDRCLEQVTPASTFKIFNSLVALDNAIMQDDRTVIPWDSIVRKYPKWNGPLTLREAFRESSVPHFQELARRAGLPLIQRMLDTGRYGNKTISKIDSFWLDGTLRISADEQVGMLKRMYFYELPFSERSQRIVKSMMLWEDSSAKGYRLYYKTGWGDAPSDRALLWVTGFMERIEKVKEDERSMNKSDQRVYPYFFAQHFTIAASDTSRNWKAERIVMAKEALREFRSR